MGNVILRQTFETEPQSAPPLAPAEEAAGRRIRWQRDPDDPDRILIFDAVTGKIIAVVRSLFDPWAA